MTQVEPSSTVSETELEPVRDENTGVIEVADADIELIVVDEISAKLRELEARAEQQLRKRPGIEDYDGDIGRYQADMLSYAGFLEAEIADLRRRVAGEARAGIKGYELAKTVFRQMSDKDRQSKTIQALITSRENLESQLAASEDKQRRYEAELSETIKALDELRIHEVAYREQVKELESTLADTNGKLENLEQVLLAINPAEGVVIWRGAKVLQYPNSNSHFEQFRKTVQLLPRQAGRALRIAHRATKNLVTRISQDRLDSDERTTQSDLVKSLYGTIEEHLTNPKKKREVAYVTAGLDIALGNREEASILLDQVIRDEPTLATITDLESKVNLREIIDYEEAPGTALYIATTCYLRNNPDQSTKVRSAFVEVLRRDGSLEDLIFPDSENPTDSLIRETFQAAVQDYKIEKARQLESQGKLAEALTVLNLITDQELIQREKFGILTSYGLQLEQEGRFSEACAALEEAYAINQDQVGPDLGRNLRRLGDSHYEKGEKMEALTSYERACVLDPSNPYAQWGIARTTDDPKRQLEGYIKIFTAPIPTELKAEIIAEIPEAIKEEIASYQIQEGKRLRDNGQLSEAAVLLSSASDLAPDNIHVRYFLATTYEQQGNLGEAVRNYQKVLETKPNNRWARKGITRIGKNIVPQIKELRDQGQYDLAKEYCEVLTEISPASFEARYLAGTIQERSGNLTEAESLYKAALDIRDSTWARKGLQRVSRTQHKLL